MTILNEDAIEQNLISLLQHQGYSYFNGDCKLDCVPAYIPLGDKPDETIRNRSLRPQSGERH